MPFARCRRTRLRRGDGSTEEGVRSGVAPDLEDPREGIAVGGGNLDAEVRRLDRVETMAVDPLKVSFYLSDGMLAADQAIVAHGLGLRRAHEIDVLRLLAR